MGAGFKLVGPKKQCWIKFVELRKRVYMRPRAEEVKIASGANTAFITTCVQSLTKLSVHRGPIATDVFDHVFYGGLVCLYVAGS